MNQGDQFFLVQSNIMYKCAVFNVGPNLLEYSTTEVFSPLRSSRWMPVDITTDASMDINEFNDRDDCLDDEADAFALMEKYAEESEQTSFKRLSSLVDVLSKNRRILEAIKEHISERTSKM